ncbi:cytidine deaminase [Desulfurobacterium atlanticum]|uniref:Cytidine deaminase n=1 Tax=Desulfurobacterium atlanticum TaxID=240169 RepID=A0A238Y235_9BACT|nr:cytidine deaminase [Desulfurobacterium atlanticum]SNR65177.1 cytidine deaminase [Desulfurobacterium atlanticum]
MEELLKLAKEHVKHCYCPYSDFHVVAVLETISGKKFVGVNVENSSYGLTVCAERVAIFKAISEGEKNFSKILIYSPDGTPFPCGACRQVMAEFCSEDFEVIVATENKILSYTLKKLLPFSFNLNR